jgi:hypothetical protein
LKGRLFTFGCSFTNYRWSTWADILGYEYKEFYNWGQSAAGNHYIFNSIIEADQRNQFGPDDTVIVCWTNAMREDRYVKNRWITTGNIMTSPMYTKEFITDAVCERGNLIRDLAFIKSIRDILLARPGITWKFMSMCPILQVDPWDPARHQHSDVVDVYQDVVESILPSFTDVLGQNYWKINKQKRFQKSTGIIDYHPTPEEHLTYLDAVLPGWVTNEEIRATIIQESKNIQMTRTGLSTVTRL